MKPRYIQGFGRLPMTATLVFASTWLPALNCCVQNRRHLAIDAYGLCGENRSTEFLEKVLLRGAEEGYMVEWKLLRSSQYAGLLMRNRGIAELTRTLLRSSLCSYHHP